MMMKLGNKICNADLYNMLFWFTLTEFEHGLINKFNLEMYFRRYCLLIISWIWMSGNGLVLLRAKVVWYEPICEYGINQISTQIRDTLLWSKSNWP